MWGGRRDEQMKVTLSPAAAAETASVGSIAATHTAGRRFLWLFTMASFGAGGGYCFDWQAGRCNRGASCRFSHDCDGGAGEGPPSAANGVCFDWEQGSCSRGNSCRFLHQVEGVN